MLSELLKVYNNVIAGEGSHFVSFFFWSYVFLYLGIFKKNDFLWKFLMCKIFFHNVNSIFWVAHCIFLQSFNVYKLSPSSSTRKRSDAIQTSSKSEFLKVQLRFTSQAKDPSSLCKLLSWNIVCLCPEHNTTNSIPLPMKPYVLLAAIM